MPLLITLRRDSRKAEMILNTAEGADSRHLSPSRCPTFFSAIEGDPSTMALQKRVLEGMLPCFLGSNASIPCRWCHRCLNQASLTLHAMQRALSPLAGRTLGHLRDASRKVCVALL